MSATAADVEQVDDVYVVNTHRAVRVDHAYRVEGARVTASELASQRLEMLVTVGDLLPLAAWEKRPAARRATAPTDPVVSPDDAAADQIIRDGEARLQELRERRQELSFDALTDPKAEKELAAVEADLAVAEQSLERGRLAARERARRSSQAAVDAATARKAEGRRRAGELQQERRALAGRIDKKLVALARDLGELEKLGVEQAHALVAGGAQSPQANASAWLRSAQVAAAAVQACREAGVPERVMVPLNAPSARAVRSLADMTPPYPPLVGAPEEAA